MSKYKVDEFVRVKKDLRPGAHYNCVYFAEAMRVYCGQILKIRGTLGTGKYYLVDERNVELGWTFTDDMLEPCYKKYIVTDEDVSKMIGGSSAFMDILLK